MSNFSNCKTCEYKHMERGNGHCYMFKEEPADTCRKHKLLKSEKRTPCGNPHCECPIGECSHPGCFDDRANTHEDFCMVLIEGRGNAENEASPVCQCSEGSRATVKA